MTTSGRARPDALGTAERPAEHRVIPANRHDAHDPAEPWEVPATEEDLRELSTRRFERLPHRPASLAEVPARALEDLGSVLGELAPEQLFVIPRSSRTVGEERGTWVLTPTEVVGVGRGKVAVWLDDPSGPRVRATIPFGDVVAILDRTILLYGRLEIIGLESSVVVRYNTVGQPELRGLLLPLRRAAAPVSPTLPEGLGRDPGELPHKWMALVRSSEVLPRGMDRLVVAAGDLRGPKPLLHNGVAVLSSTELVVATVPTTDVRTAQYGVDLLVVARGRVLAIDGREGTLTLTVETALGPVDIRLAAHRSLVAEATRLLGPLVGGGTPGSAPG